MNRRQHIAAAVEHLDAVMIHGHGYAYFADETGSWWMSRADDMALLGKMLQHPDRAERDSRDNDRTDTYSLWCARHLAREMPHGYSWIDRRKVTA